MKYISVLVALSLIGHVNCYAHLPGDEVVNLHGKILNLKTRALVNADVDIFCNSDFIKVCSEKALQGEFTVPLETYGMYIVSISAPGYLDTTDTLWVVSEKRKTIDKDFYIAPVEVGITVRLNNIYFDFGKDHLSDQSFPELDKAAHFFKENPGTKFEIGGHTDSSGPDDYNLILSQARAQAVVNYLVNHGVDRIQLTAHGYGETRPVYPGKTKEAEAKNRRVEFKVLTIALSRNK